MSKHSVGFSVLGKFSWFFQTFFICVFVSISVARTSRTCAGQMVQFLFTVNNFDFHCRFLYRDAMSCWSLHESILLVLCIVPLSDSKTRREKILAALGMDYPVVRFLRIDPVISGSNPPSAKLLL